VEDVGSGEDAGDGSDGGSDDDMNAVIGDSPSPRTSVPVDARGSLFKWAQGSAILVGQRERYYPMFKSSSEPSPADAGHSEHVARLKTWVRESLALPPEISVMVTELRCTEPGCPPKETVIAVLRGPGDTLQGKVPCGVADLTRSDVERLSAELSTTPRTKP
jgi:hypothetical protein